METVKAKIFGCSIDDTYFSHLSENEKEECRKLVMRNVAHVVLIYDDNAHKMAAVIEMQGDKIHIRECGGSFIYFRNALENYCTMFARFTGKRAISLCSKKRGILETAIKKHGFRNFAENEVIKEIA